MSNPTVYTRAPVPKEARISGWKERRAAADRRRQEVRERHEDPLRAAIGRVRRAATALQDANREGSIRWAELNGPVPNPLPRTLHPQRAAALAALMATWSDDHSQAITPTATAEELAGERAAVARTELEAANLALFELEGRSVAVAPMPRPVAPVPAITVPEQPAKRGRGRPPKALAAALAAEGALED